MALFSRSALMGLVFLFLILIVHTYPVSAQQFPREDDRQTTDRVRPIQTTPIDISGAGGSFYFIDQLGLSGLSELGGGASVDPDTYLLGPGDLVSITLRGNVNGSFRGMMINPQGMIIIPNVGSVEVGGISITEAAEKVAELVDEAFQETESRLTLERPRNVKINIVGDVPYPGSYFMPASSRLYEAMQAAFQETEPAPGAEAAGSQQMQRPKLSSDFIMSGRYGFRSVTLKREGGEEMSADLVSFIINGDMSENPQMQHGDVIYIYEQAAHAPKISISGSVVNGRTVEYRRGDTVEKLLELAGGFSSDADQNDVRIYRYTFDGIQEIEFNAEDELELQPNDRIVVGFDREQRSDFSAEVTGEAESPGVFPIKNGVTTARELLEFAGGTSELALPNAARLIRAQQAYNSLRIQRTSDQLTEGLQYLDLKSSLGRNYVFVDLNDTEKLDDILVYNNDRLHIPSGNKSIFVFGQVMNAGYYTYDPGMDAEDYIQQAGGYALAAQAERVFVIKAGSHAWMRPYETVIESGDLVFVDREPYESLQARRGEAFNQRELRNRNIQLIFAGLSTIATVLTTYVALRRL